MGPKGGPSLFSDLLGNFLFRSESFRTGHKGLAPLQWFKVASVADDADATTSANFHELWLIP